MRGQNDLSRIGGHAVGARHQMHRQAVHEGV